MTDTRRRCRQAMSRHHHPAVPAGRAPPGTVAASQGSPSIASQSNIPGQPPRHHVARSATRPTADRAAPPHKYRTTIPLLRGRSTSLHPKSLHSICPIDPARSAPSATVSSPPGRHSSATPSRHPPPSVSHLPSSQPLPPSAATTSHPALPAWLLPRLPQSTLLPRPPPGVLILLCSPPSASWLPVSAYKRTLLSPSPARPVPSARHCTAPDLFSASADPHRSGASIRSLTRHPCPQVSQPISPGPHPITRRKPSPDRPTLIVPNFQPTLRAFAASIKPQISRFKPQTSNFKPQASSSCRRHKPVALPVRCLPSYFLPGVCSTNSMSTVPEIDNDNRDELSDSEVVSSYPAVALSRHLLPPLYLFLDESPPTSTEKATVVASTVAPSPDSPVSAEPPGAFHDPLTTDIAYMPVHTPHRPAHIYSARADSPASNMDVKESREGMPPSEFCLESLPSASPQSSSWLFYLPYEIWIEIFAQIAPDSPLAFALVCRRWLELSKDPHARARFLMIKHKESVLSLYYAFKYDRPILATTGVPQAMLSLGATIPRFLVQAVDKEAHRHDRRRRNYIPPRLLMFFLTEGYRRFGDDMDYNEDDLRRFESALLGTNSHPSVAVTDVRRLITEYGFVPLGNLSASVEEIVYKVSLVDLGLVEVMKRNGLKLAQVNDLVLERVFWRPDFSNSMLSQYLAVGFSLTDEAIKKGLQIARDRTLNVLKEQCSSAKLGRIAVEALRDMMGPMIRGWSFSLEPIDYLYQRFEITEDDMRYILLTKCDPQYSDKEFPATRCYMKVDPCPVWRWVLRIYGPEHVFTQACFDDAISRAVAHRELHQLHNVYVERGIRFYPRHIKILACRVLHRDMTNNALFLFRILKEQALASQIDMDADEKAAWIQALQSEICDNQDWIHRMRTLQLEGGTRGKVYPLQRPPEDGTVFLEEAQELLVALDPPPPTLKRTRSGRSIIQGTRHSARRRESPSVGAGLVKRVQAWFERTE